MGVEEMDPQEKGAGRGLRPRFEPGESVIDAPSTVLCVTALCGAEAVKALIKARFRTEVVDRDRCGSLKPSQRELLGQSLDFLGQLIAV